MPRQNKDTAPMLGHKAPPTSNKGPFSWMRSEKA